MVTSYNAYGQKKDNQMKFNELKDKQKVEKVKENYINIIEEIHLNDNELEKYIPSSGTSNEGGKSREELALKIKSIKIKEDCICEPRELDIDVDQIPDEFEVFIDFARQRAELQVY